MRRRPRTPLPEQRRPGADPLPAHPIPDRAGGWAEDGGVTCRGHARRVQPRPAGHQPARRKARTRAPSGRLGLSVGGGWLDMGYARLRRPDPPGQARPRRSVDDGPGRPRPAGRHLLVEDLDAPRSILIADYLVGLTHSTASNLEQTVMHRDKLKSAWTTEGMRLGARIRAGQGKPEMLSQLTDQDQNRSVEIDAHLSGFFRATGSVLNTLVGLIVGTAGPATSSTPVSRPGRSPEVVAGPRRTRSGTTGSPRCEPRSSARSRC